MTANSIRFRCVGCNQLRALPGRRKGLRLQGMRAGDRTKRNPAGPGRGVCQRQVLKGHQGDE